MQRISYIFCFALPMTTLNSVILARCCRYTTQRISYIFCFALPMTTLNLTGMACI